MSRIAWVDCGAGASGDMLLGALVAAGVPLEVISEAAEAVAPEKLTLSSKAVVRNGLAATHVTIEGTESHHHRTWLDIRGLLESAPLDFSVRQKAQRTFELLAHAEARVHSTTPEKIHFHEVGALDAIADIVGACAGFAYLGLDRIVVSPIAVGSGTARAAHGVLPVPVPAVVELLAASGAPSLSGQIGDQPVGELCTPTGAALLIAHAADWGPQPPMRVATQGFGAGTRDPKGRANVVRLLVGEATGVSGDGSISTQLVLETNVDDLDPRLWPAVLTRLLDAGAADAWLTPILMKKGRPAHTLSVLADAGQSEAVRAVLFAETTAIGVRSYPVTKEALPREIVVVSVLGEKVRVKVASRDKAVVNVQPEYDDIAAVAARTGQPVKTVLAAASEAARQLTTAEEGTVEEGTVDGGKS